MKRTEAYFIEHCDHQHCDLGTFTYICPHCGKTIDDYEIWWEQDEIYNGKRIAFECENCKTELIVGRGPDRCEYYVKEIETNE